VAAGGGGGLIVALVLVKEDGSGRADANSYASATDGDAYHEGHLYALTWTGASTAQKEAALVMAARVLDACCQFCGWRRSNAQALQWPRAGAVDPDRRDVQFSVLDSRLGPYFEDDKVPKVIQDAACEQARELLTADRTAAPAGEGIKQMNLVGSLGVMFDLKDRPPMLSHLVQTLLAKVGSLVRESNGTAKLVRT
jgi:hypothetical protein